MRAENKADIRRIEAEAAAERERIEHENTEEREFLQQTIISMQESMAHMAAQQRSAIHAASRAHIDKAVSRPAIQPTPPVQSAVPTPTPVNPPPRVAQPPPEMSLQGQPASLDMSPQALAEAAEPIKSLRRNNSTANAATIILKEVGLAGAIALDKAHNKGKGSHKSSSRLGPRVAKWPNEYMFRMDDEDPSYDSLTETEFVSGYLSIIEEVTPVTPENKRLLVHIEYLRQLMDDCISFEWHQVRAAHRHVLSSIDYNRLKWENVAAVKEAKAVALHRARNVKAEHKVAAQSESSGSPCALFQNGTCTQLTDHPVDGVMAFHCCAWCYKKNGSQNPHPRKVCRKYNNRGKAKNGKSAPREAQG